MQVLVKTLGLLFLFLLFVPPAAAQFGMSKTKVILQVRHPPELYIPGRQLRLNVRSEVAAGHTVAAQIKPFLEQALARNFDLNSGQPETSLQLVVHQFDPRVHQEARQLTLNLHAGYTTQYDNKGNGYKVEVCNEARANTNWIVAQGELSATLTVEDLATRALIASETVPSSYNDEFMVGGPQLCGGGSGGSLGEAIARALTGGRGGGQLQYRQPAFRDAVGLGNYLVGMSKQSLQAKLFGRIEPLEVLLATPDELKPGNHLAVAQQWEQALQAWESVSINKPKTEAYRQYNLGVAHEALAYATFEYEPARQHLQGAEAAYRQASELHSGEKYFRPAFARVSRAREVLEQSHAQNQQRQAEAEKRRAKLEEEAAAAAAPAVPVDSTEAAQFRDYLRLRLSRFTGGVTAAQREKFQQDGVRFGLSQVEAVRVVGSEEQRLQEAMEKLASYRDFYRECWGDLRIGVEERRQLDVFREKLGLSEEQTSAVEAEFQAPKSAPRPKARPTTPPRP